MENEKENLITKMSIICIDIFVIIIIIALVVIWTGDNSDKGKNLVFSYNSEIDFKQMGYESIYNEVRSLLFKNNSSLLYDKMDKDFLEENSLTKDNFLEYLETNNLVGNNIKFLSYNYYEGAEGVTYIVKYSLTTDKLNTPTTKTLNIIETNPYEYTLSFATNSIPTKDLLEANVQTNGISFQISMMERKENYVRFSIRVVNVSNNVVNIDFRNLNTVSLLLEGNTKIKPNSVIASDDANVTLYQNSAVNREVLFPVNIENQGKIKYMVFSNIAIDSVKRTINVEF